MERSSAILLANSDELDAGESGPAVLLYLILVAPPKPADSADHTQRRHRGEDGECGAVVGLFVYVSSAIV